MNRRKQGSALVAVIWLIGLLSFITVATIRIVGFDLDVAASNIHGFRASQLAEMGIAVAANPIVERSDPILNQWSDENGEGFEVTITSEGGKFNINSIILQQDKILLQTMFGQWGLDVDQAGQVADALTDWVDPDDEESLAGAEIAFYEELGRVNQPFNRPFYSLDEMRLVHGMDLIEAVQPNWRNWFSVWTSGTLDINEAPAELIAVAAEVDYTEALIIPETVRGIDGIRDTEDDVPFGSAQEALALIGVDGSLRSDIVARFGINETTLRIESTGISPGAKRRITMVLRNRTGQPAILERTEEVIP